MSIETHIPAHIVTWFNNREWAGGLKLKVHDSTNILEFSLQYEKNKAYWESAFAYLRDTDLESVAPGKYVLDGDHVYVLVSEGNTKDLKDTKWEAHLKYIDIQYVIKGKEKIGVATLAKADRMEPFNSGKDIGFFNLPESEGKYYVAEPGKFFIFFPQDAHRPGVRAEESEWVKKVVIKIAVG